MTSKNRIIQTAIIVGIFTSISLAQAQQGSDSAGSGSSATNSNQSSQQPKSGENKSNAANKGEDKEKINRNVKETIKRDKTHELKPSEYDPPK